MKIESFKRQQALQWALFQNSTSGHTAKQFVDYLYGELHVRNVEMAK